MRRGADTVHTDIGESQAVWSWVRDLCIKPGAAPDDLVPFDKVCQRGRELTRPSFAARGYYLVGCW